MEPISPPPLVDEPIKLPKVKPIKVHAQGAGIIPLDSIIIGDRYRDKYSKDAGSTTKYIEEELAPSIAECGLIQLPTLKKRADGNLELVAGWCRIQAMRVLGHKEIPYVLVDDIPSHMARQMELIENLRRKRSDWRDEAVAIWEIHQLKVAENTKDHKSWGYRETGALVSRAAGQLKDLKGVVEAIKAGDKEVCESPSLDKAKGILANRKQAQFEAELLKRHHATPSGKPKKVDKLSGPADKSAPISTTLVTPARQPAQSGPAVQIHLSEQLFNMDCHEWFNVAPSESVDLIYTDIPYGIDMDMLDDVAGIEIVKESHHIDENVDQMLPFLQGAFKVLKPDSFLIFWMDIKHWEKLKLWGEQTGFAVQPFPSIIGKLDGAKNRASHCQWTKDYEYVMWMRKGKATLREPQTSSIKFCTWRAERQMQNNPFAKPFEASQWLLKPVIHPGMTILDCYAGGGSLIRATINLNCRPIAIEKDPKQFPALMENIKALYREKFNNNVEFI